jgi:hypothetical protein
MSDNRTVQEGLPRTAGALDEKVPWMRSILHGTDNPVEILALFRIQHPIQLRGIIRSRIRCSNWLGGGIGGDLSPRALIGRQAELVETTALFPQQARDEEQAVIVVRVVDS